MADLKNLLAFALGEINEGALADANFQESDEAFSLEDEEIIEECAEITARLYIQSELLAESAAEIDAAVNETYTRLQNYLQGQGIITEATITVGKNQSAMVLGKDAQINRLTKIFTLKLARKANTKDYKKFKIGAQLKKNSMAKMMKQFGKKANLMAKKAWKKMGTSKSRIDAENGEFKKGKR